MHPFKLARRFGVGFVIIAGCAIGLVAIAMASGVTPAMAATLVGQPDLQIAAFMIPLTVLILAVLYETARTVWRGRIPAVRPAQRAARPRWQDENER